MAEKQVECIVKHELFKVGPRKGQIKPGSEMKFYKIGDKQYDWYEIIDLEEWM